MSAEATRTRLRLEGVVLDCPDPRALAAFYGELLGWRLAYEGHDQHDEHDTDPTNDWVTLVNPDGGANICFQRDPEFIPPTWPARDRHQMSHLDIAVDDLESEHHRAMAVGARLLDAAPQTFRVYADPAGHPFCLCSC